MTITDPMSIDLIRDLEELERLRAERSAKPPPATAVLVHTASGHPVYVALSQVGVAREASAADAATGAASSVIVQGVSIPLDEDLNTLLGLLGWP